MKTTLSLISRSIPAFALICMLCGCGNENEKAWQGYLEADMVYVSPESGGIIDMEFSNRGDIVKKGDKLFQLDKTEYQAAYSEAEANLKKASATLQDLQKGAREEEINQIKATISKLEAVSALSDIEHERTRDLHGKDAISKKEYDTAKWNSERDRWALTEAQKSLQVAMLPERQDRITAAKENANAAEESLAAAKWRLEQRVVFAPANARIFDVFLRKGEYASPGNAVMALIPDENMKLRFFVKYEDAAKLKIGDKLQFYTNEQKQNYNGTINYISQKPEYTPPVIYSQENSSKLVFMIEAKPEIKDAVYLNPGLPVLVKVLK